MEFVHALKTSSEKEKIVVARKAWDDQNLDIPNKGQLIADWILATFLKDKIQNAVVDIAYWSLLADILEPVQSPSRPVKSWLVPLLNRVPVASILVSFLRLLPNTLFGLNHSLTLHLRRSFNVIWPLAAHKMSTDVLLDCLGALIQSFATFNDDVNFLHVANSITLSFMQSFVTANNKKKISLAFLQAHLSSWIQIISASEQSSVQDRFTRTLYGAGIDILFNADTLRQSSRTDSPANPALFQHLETILPTSSTCVAQVLPLLFKSYVRATRMHRHAIFIQGSSQNTGFTREIQAASMQFFASCQRLLEAATLADAVWASRIQLLLFVSHEIIFSASDPDSRSMFEHITDLALTALESTRKGAESWVTQRALETLSALVSIDYDIVAPALPRILPVLLLVHCQTISDHAHPAFVFLDLLLEYHTKTRSMDIYISTVLDALAATSISALSRDTQTTYSVLLSGPLVHPLHLNKLNKAIQGFLTAGQVLPIVRTVVGVLEKTWASFMTAHEYAIDPKSKRQKKLEITTSPDIIALSLSLEVQVALVILTSLPSQFLSGDGHAQDITLLLDATQHTFVETALKKTSRIISKHGQETETSTWNLQIIAAAVTRLEFALNARGWVSRPNIKVTTRRLTFVQEKNILPELQFETFRALLFQCSLEEIDHASIFDTLLDYLENHLGDGDIQWSGFTCSLIFGDIGKSRTALAVLDLLLEQWLPVFDLLASSVQLERLVKIFMVSYNYLSASATMFNRSACFVRTLRSAMFWEQSNIRGAILSYMNTSTSMFDKVDIATVFTSPTAYPVNEDDLSRCISAYNILTFVPMEYLARTTRTELAQRAVIADTLMGVSLDEQSGDRYKNAIMVLRLFLKRFFVSLGNGDYNIANLSQYICQIMNPRVPLIDSTVRTLTLDLVETYFLAIGKDKLKTSFLTDMADFFGRSSQSEQFFSQNLCLHGFISFVDVLNDNFTQYQFDERVMSRIRALYEHIVSTIRPKISEVSLHANPETILNHLEIFHAWSYILALGRWLGLTEVDNHLFGQTLLPAIVSAYPSPSALTKEWTDASSAIFFILLEELTSAAVDRKAHLELIVAAYLTLRQGDELDGPTAKLSGVFSSEDFSSVLNLLLQLIKSCGHPPKTSINILRLDMTLLHDPPQGTLKIIQNHVTQCLNVFVRQDVFTTGSVELSICALEFVRLHCSDRPAALRSIDLASIWSLLCKFLRGSSTHDSTTSAIIFQHIVAIINSLVRLRRDLVILSLPHLGLILRQLLSLIRKPRDNLGKKQHKLVSDTFPMWINLGSHPLAPAEAKSLSRLLVSLTTKTMVRSYSSVVKSQRAESLSKPFAKHSVYVLKAYVDALNDPLCTIGPEIRKDIYPGIFALCDILSEHSRDAMMASALDIGGKTTIKSLWKEYEKQKYVGKG